MAADRGDDRLGHAALAAVRRETGHWRHALGVAAYLFALAYLMAWITYRVAGAWGAT